MNGRKFLFELVNPEFRIHFDRGDVAWLRAYCHLLCGTIAAVRAVDLELAFYRGMSSTFPNMQSPPDHKDRTVDRENMELKIVDPPRLGQMRLHLLAVAELNPETWKYIRDERDDDYEWLPNSNRRETKSPCR